MTTQRVLTRRLFDYLGVLAERPDGVIARRGILRRPRRLQAWMRGATARRERLLHDSALVVPEMCFHSVTWRCNLECVGCYAAAGFALVLLHAGLTILVLPASAPAWLGQVQDIALSLFIPVLIVDLLLPFFPLWSYLGRQVWNWSRVAWGALAVAALGSIALRFAPA